MNGKGWRLLFKPEISYFLATKPQLGFSYPLFSDSYIPRTVVIGAGNKVKFNSSGALPTEDEMGKWIEEIKATGIEQPAENLPSQIKLEQNYPNPFNSSTNIVYLLQKSQPVQLVVLNSRGEVVKKMIDGWQSAGVHQVAFDGSAYESGLYFYQLTAGKQKNVGRMLYLK